MKTVLSVNNLTKTFQNAGKMEIQAVTGVSFDLGYGESLGIIGESGSGKSTVAKLIMRLIEPTKGTILLEGEDITKWRGTSMRKAYQRMQMVFQSPVESFDPRQKIGNGIAEPLRNSGMAKREARTEMLRLLERCGLPTEYGKRYPHQLSGGQCQRAAIARAISVKPKLLICDEATSALDVTIQQEIMELLRELRRELGLSVLFISHDLALVQSFCDRVLVMYQGQIIEQGETDKIVNHPKEEYTKNLIDSVL